MGVKCFLLNVSRSLNDWHGLSTSDALNAAHRILVCVRFKHGSICVNANTVAACSSIESDFTSAREKKWNLTKHRGLTQKWPSDAPSLHPHTLTCTSFSCYCICAQDLDCKQSHMVEWKGRVHCELQLRINISLFGAVNYLSDLLQGFYS